MLSGVAPKLLVQQRVDERAGVLVVDDRDDELHARSIGGASDPGSISECGRRGCGQLEGSTIAPDEPWCFDPAGSHPCRPTHRSPRPLVRLIAAIDGVAQGGHVQTAPRRRPGGGSVARTAMGAVPIQDPDRPAAQAVASSGLTRPRSGGGWPTDVTDPAHPFAAAALGRTATFDREATMPDGTPVIGAYLPLMVSSGGVDMVLGSMGLGWLAPHTFDAAERRPLDGVRQRSPRSRSIAPGCRPLRPSGPTGSSGWPHTDPFTGLANERTVGRIPEF